VHHLRAKTIEIMVRFEIVATKAGKRAIALFEREKLLQ